MLGLAWRLQRGSLASWSLTTAALGAVAGALVSMLAHTAAHQYGFEFWGIRTAAVRDAMARQISWGVTGIKPPG